MDSGQYWINLISKLLGLNASYFAGADLMSPTVATMSSYLRETANTPLFPCWIQQGYSVTAASQCRMFVRIGLQVSSNSLGLASE